MVGNIVVTLPRPGLLRDYNMDVNCTVKCTAGKALFCRGPDSQNPHLVHLLAHVKYKTGNGEVCFISIQISMLPFALSNGLYVYVQDVLN